LINSLLIERTLRSRGRRRYAGAGRRARARLNCAVALAHRGGGARNPQELRAKRAAAARALSPEYSMERALRSAAARAHQYLFRYRQWLAQRFGITRTLTD